MGAIGRERTSLTGSRHESSHLRNQTRHMVNSLKSLVIAAVIWAVSLPCMAWASTFRLAPDVAFEHRPYESEGKDYLARVHGNEIVYRPEGRILVINRNEIHLNESINAFLTSASLRVDCCRTLNGRDRPDQSSTSERARTVVAPRQIDSKETAPAPFSLRVFNCDDARTLHHP